MRLQEIYYICRTVQESWNDLSFDEAKAAGNATYYKLKNADAVRGILADLDAIESFQETIASIRNRSYGFAQSSGEITIDPRVKSALLGDYQKLYIKVSTITELFESLDYRQDSEGFDIKLPPDISLSDLSKCTKDLDTIFSTCPLFANQENKIKFTAVDVGSMWFTFLVVGTTAVVTLRLIAELVDKALVIRSHYLTSREQEERVRSLQLGNDALENAMVINKQITKGLLAKVSTELAEEHNISDPEDLGRLRNSIQLMADWMDKGMEVYASIQAPEETKAVFPPIEKQTLPEGIIGLLTEGTDSTS